MEIYYYQARWLGLVFLIPAILIFLIEVDVIAYDNSPPSHVSYIVIFICSLISLQCFFGSTQLVFDNRAKACCQIRRHFYGEKVVSHPYSEIKNIEVRLTRRNGASLRDIHYEIGFTKETQFLGQPATRYERLKRFGGEQEDYNKAVSFGKKISEHSGIAFHDGTQIVRPGFR